MGRGRPCAIACGLATFVRHRSSAGPRTVRSMWSGSKRVLRKWAGQGIPTRPCIGSCGRHEREVAIAKAAPEPVTGPQGAEMLQDGCVVEIRIGPEQVALQRGEAA